MAFNDPAYTLSSPASGDDMDSPSHSLQHRETKRFVDDMVTKTQAITGDIASLGAYFVQLEGANAATSAATTANAADIATLNTAVTAVSAATTANAADIAALESEVAGMTSSNIWVVASTWTPGDSIPGASVGDRVLQRRS